MVWGCGPLSHRPLFAVDLSPGGRGDAGGNCRPVLAPSLRRRGPGLPLLLPSPPRGEGPGERGFGAATPPPPTPETTTGTRRCPLRHASLGNGAPEEIRTPSLLIRSQMLYPVELRALSVCRGSPPRREPEISRRLPAVQQEIGPSTQSRQRTMASAMVVMLCRISAR